MRKHVSQADLQASIQPRVGGYNKNNDRSRGLVGVVAPIQGAQRDYVIIDLSLPFPPISHYLEVSGSSPETGKFSFCNFEIILVII